MRLTEEDQRRAKAGELTCHGCYSERVRKECGLCGHHFCLDCYGAVDHCIWCEIKLGIDVPISEVLAPMDDTAKAAEAAEIEDDLNQAVMLLSEEELQEKLFLLATLLRQASEDKGLSRRSAADYVLGFLKPGG